MSNLTKYEPASFGELISLSLPLMLSALSGFLMLFIDRVLLANYSTEAVNSVSAAGMIAFTFIIGGISIAGISEVFVGQHNGAENYEEVAKPVWQMIWFSLIAGVFFSALGYLGADWLIPQELQKHGSEYFSIIMYAGVLFTIQAALAGFFAGVGNPKIITIAAIIGNLCNLILGLILIFGYGDIVPAMGPKGAAIATVIAEFINVAILFAIMLSPANRRKYFTHKISIAREPFMACIRIGTPSSLAHVFEFAAWSTIYHIAASASFAHITVLTLAHNIGVFFFFLTQGLEKGVTAAASNLIGSERIDLIRKLMFSACKIHVIAIIIVAVPLLFFPHSMIQFFTMNSNGLVDEYIVSQITMALRFLWFFIILDGLVWAMAGVLTAAGDTKFVMYINTACAWFFGVLPIYIMINYFTNQPYYVQMLTACYAITNFIFFTWRYLNGGWKTNAKLGTCTK